MVAQWSSLSFLEQEIFKVLLSFFAARKPHFPKYKNFSGADFFELGVKSYIFWNIRSFLESLFPEI